MADRLQTFRNLVSDAADSWQANVANPYIIAYNTAYQSYVKTFDKQKESNKAQAELFVSIALILPGSVLAVAAASKSLQVLARRQAIRALAFGSARRGALRYKAVIGDAGAKFAIAGILDVVKDQAKVKKKIEEAVKDVISKTGDLLLTDPLNRDKQLNSWITNHKLLAYAAAEAIENDPAMNNDAKNKAYAELRLAPIASKPTGVIVPALLAPKIEHAFYMIWLLDSDELVTTIVEPVSYGMGTTLGQYSSKPIDVLPSSPEHPKNNKNLPKGQWVGIKRPGGDVEDKIDELNMQLRGREFYESHWYGKNDTKKFEELLAAERVLKWLSDQTQPLSALGVQS
jgi:hypothetical protein